VIPLTSTCPDGFVGTRTCTDGSVIAATDKCPGEAVAPNMYLILGGVGVIAVAAIVGTVLYKKSKK
jgi:hypothetical protein